MRKLQQALFAAAVVFLAFGRPSPILAQEDYVGGTFIYYTLERHELEAELWLDRFQDDGELVATTQLEYGFTNHFMMDVTLRYFHVDQTTAFDEGLIELRRRFGEPGDHAVDVAASLELARENEENFIEPQLILSKDFSGWNATANLTEAFNVTEGGPPTFAWALGIRTPSLGRLKLGLELMRPVTDLARFIRVMPQARFKFGEVALGLGVGITVDGEAPNFGRITAEFEF